MDLSLVKSYPKKAGVRVSTHFTSDEFDCPCPGCTETKIHPKLIELLEEIRIRAGAPLMIHSGYRCPAHQAKLKADGLHTAEGISTHELGCAVDVSAHTLSGVELALTAAFVGFKAIGTARDWIHADLRGTEPGGRERRWTYP